MLRCSALLTAVLVMQSARADVPSLDSDALDQVVREALTTFEVPGAAVAIVRDGKVVYLRGHGVRRLGSTEPVTPETLFAIASCTKAFTAASIACLIQDGKMKWDDPVRKHLPWFRLADPLADREVTLRDLLCHRTGVARNDLLWYRAPWSLEESVRRLAFVRPSSSFRSRYEYANIPYIAAGLAVAAASGEPWHEFVRRRLLEPLDMKGPVFRASEATQSADAASPHAPDATGKLRAIAWYPDEDQVRGSGSIKAGVRDLSNWLRFQLGDGTFEGQRVLSGALLREMQTPQVIVPRAADEQARFPEQVTRFTAYGLGWSVSDYRGRLVVGHGGSADGFRSLTTLLPEQRLGLVVLSNRGPTAFPEAVSKSLVDRLIGVLPRDWNTFYREQEQKTIAQREARLKHQRAEQRQGTKPSLDLEAYTGSYADPAYGNARVDVEGDSLRVKWSAFTLRLEHYHLDTFLARGDLGERSDDRVVFRLGGDGRVEGMRFLAQEFRKAGKP